MAHYAASDLGLGLFAYVPLLGFPNNNGLHYPCYSFSPIATDDIDPDNVIQQLDQLFLQVDK